MNPFFASDYPCWTSSWLHAQSYVGIWNIFCKLKQACLRSWCNKLLLKTVSSVGKRYKYILLPQAFESVVLKLDAS